MPYEQTNTFTIFWKPRSIWESGLIFVDSSTTLSKPKVKEGTHLVWYSHLFLPDHLSDWVTL